MDLCLIAASEFSWLSVGSWLNILQMAAGLGVVIFVHELGHFLVAKACGVKCEKFYLGFDVPMPKIGPFQIPSKLVHFQYGETEYGIGIIPLGGYVKMLGQDDNPANAEKEAERTRVKKDATSGEDAAAHGDHHESITDVNMEPQPLADQVPYEVDPRSYTAKNVPQRMAIISAGVIMNVIFAVIFATIAYKVGVPYMPTYIGGTLPGSPAWQADLPVGGRISQIGKQGQPREHLRYRQDFQQGVLLHGYKTDLDLRIEPRGGGEAEWISIRPQPRDVGMMFGPMAMVGVEPMAEPKVAAEPMAGFPAALAKTQMIADDRIVSATAGGESLEIDIYPDLNAFLARHVDDEVQLQIERTHNAGQPEEKKETLTVELVRRPLRTLGVQMEMGAITAIQQNSPAAAADLKVGDVLEAIDGKEIADPMLVADALRRRVGEEVTLTVLRGDKKSPVEIKVTPRPVSDSQTRINADEPVLIDALGATFRVEPKVIGVDTASPLHGKIAPGDVITNFQIIPAGSTAEERRAAGEKLMKQGYSLKEVSFVKGKYSDGKMDWPAAYSSIQWLPEGTKVKLTYERKGKSETVEVASYELADYYFPARGFSVSIIERIHTAQSWGEAFYLGRRETWESLGLVVTFLKKLVTGQIALTSLGGPGTIAVAATSEASRGPAALLIFLTMLSANLAVVNFLPIPVLDGGHMMFLAYEGIFRRPVNEKWQIRLSLLGLSFVLCLMMFVIGLDFYRLSGMAG